MKVTNPKLWDSAWLENRSRKDHRSAVRTLLSVSCFETVLLKVETSKAGLEKFICFSLSQQHLSESYSSVWTSDNRQLKDGHRMLWVCVLIVGWPFYGAWLENWNVFTLGLLFACLLSSCHWSSLLSVCVCEHVFCSCQRHNCKLYSSDAKIITN